MPPSPLPTTVIERYLARPSHGTGMVFSITLVLKGKIQIGLLRRSWIDAVQQHPRMFAKLAGQGRSQRWKLQERAADDSFVYRVLAADIAAEVEDAATVCPRSGIGMKCVVQSADQQLWSIRLLFHHACCDGVGAIRMIGQVFSAYSHASDPLRRGGGSEDEEILDRRLPRVGVAQPPGQLSQPEPSGYRRQLPNAKNLWTTIRGKNVHLTQSAPCLAPRLEKNGWIHTDAEITTFQNMTRLMFSRAQSDQIREILRARKLMLNDWAVAVTLHALAELTGAAASSRNHIMILNPVEMRTWAQRRDTQNHIGLAFVRRRHEQLGNVHQSLESVRDQMQNVRRYGTANELASGIAFAEGIPGCLGLIERWGTFTPTAAVTSVASLRLGKRFGVRRESGQMWIGGAELADVFFEGAVQVGGQVSTTIWDFDQQIAVSNRTPAGIVLPNTNHRLLRSWARIAIESCEVKTESRGAALSDLE